MLRLWMFFACLFAVALAQAQESDGAVRHTVRVGDNLTAIALAYGVTVNDILALNGLDSPDLLQPGQSLVIMAAPPADVEDLESDGKQALPALDVAAPVAAADAPAFDPTDLSASICLAMFLDDSQNGILDRGESLLAGEFAVQDAAGQSRNYATDATPLCVEDLSASRYVIQAAPPAGYGLTTAPTVHVNLGAGGQVRLDFGAKAGLAAWVMPTAVPNTIETAAESPEVGRSLLMELSGLFALALAGVVLGGGLLAALLIRVR